MARQRVKLTELGKEPGIFGRLRNSKEAREYNSRVGKRAAEQKNNDLYDRADQLLARLPENLQYEALRGMADGVINVQEFVNNPVVQRNAGLAVGGTALGAAGVAGLQAYSQQANEFLPTDPLAVAGRMASNVFAGGGTVGVDPLAEARNNVNAARQLVGSENMLAALAEDEIAQMRGEQKAAMTAGDFAGLNDVQAMIDARATQLMQQPIQKADGSVSSMGFDTAQRIATEQVAMELRANDVY